MPGFYTDGEYDLAGFAVGAVKKDRLVNGSAVAEGDVVLGLPSSGVHSNGFSLVRLRSSPFISPPLPSCASSSLPSWPMPASSAHPAPGLCLSPGELQAWRMG